MRIVGILILVALAGLAYIRFAPVNLGAVSLADLPTAIGDYDAAGGFTAVRKVQGDPVEVLTRTKAAMLALPSTKVVSEVPLTFVTRSKVFGFPDVTVAMVQDGVLILRGHLVYGASDLGVNKARILRILERL